MPKDFLITKMLNLKKDVLVPSSSFIQFANEANTWTEEYCLLGCHAL
jgi:hypothetical protein